MSIVKIIVSALITFLPLLFSAYEANAGHGTNAAIGGVVTLGTGTLSAFILGLFSKVGLPSGGTPAEFQTAVAELFECGKALLVFIKNPRDFAAGREFMVQALEAAIAAGNFFIADEEWSAAAVNFLALTKAKLDAAAPKTVMGKAVPPGMISFAEAVK